MKRTIIAVAALSLFGCASEPKQPQKVEVNYVQPTEAEKNATSLGSAVVASCQKDPASKSCEQGMLMLALSRGEREAPRQALPPPPKTALQSIVDGAVNLTGMLLNPLVTVYGINKNTWAQGEAARYAAESNKSMWGAVETLGGGTKSAITVNQGDGGSYLNAGHDVISDSYKPATTTTSTDNSNQGNVSGSYNPINNCAASGVC